MPKGTLNFSEVSFWLSEANSCIERQRVELIQRNNYPFLINYYEGVDQVDALYPHVSAKQRLSVINEYFPSTNSLISEIMYQNPDIMLEAMRPDAEEGTPLMKSALSYLFDKSEALVENRLALFDMLYAGYCAVEVDQLPPSDREDLIDNPESGEPEPVESVFDKAAKNIKKAMNVKEAEDNLAKMSPAIEGNFATVQGTYIRRYDPLDVPLDWRASRLRDRRYNFKKIFMSKSEFDAKYPDFKEDVNAEENMFEHSKHKLSIHNRKVMLFEFQARLKGGKYQTIVLSPQNTMRELDTFIRPYTTNGFNMKIGTLHKYGKLYPKSFAQINKKMADEMNEYVRHMKDVAERNVPKYVSDKNKVKTDAKEALRSKNVNDLVEIDGNTIGAVTPLPATHVSLENKELLSIFQDQKNKLWSVSESRISGRSQPEFATELAIQEEGFKTRNVDIQEGLRLLINNELETGKDLIATFWDGEVFLKVTGNPKMDWYVPKMVPDSNNPDRQIVENPLTDMLTGDYMVKIDIASAAQKNRQQELNMMFFFMNQLVGARQVLIEQGKDINIDEIRKVSKEFGWNPDKIFVDHQPATVPNVPTAGGETISPEEDASRQAQAEEQAQGQA